MRNPWGSEKYHGEWSDKSSLWTPEFKKQAGYIDGNDGIFFVPLDQWRGDWGDITVCHYNEQWHETTHEGNPATFAEGGQHSAWLTFDNQEDQDVILECSQTTARIFPDGCTGDDIPQSYGYLVYDY